MNKSRTVSSISETRRYHLLIIGLVIIGIIFAILIPAINMQKRTKAEALSEVRAKHPEAVRVISVKSRFVTTTYRTVTVKNEDGSVSTYVLDVK